MDVFDTELMQAACRKLLNTEKSLDGKDSDNE